MKANAMDPNLDTLEVLLNPGLIKNKLSVLSREQAYVQGQRLLQDLLSLSRFGTPAIVPLEGPPPSSNNSINNKSDDRTLGQDETGTLQQQTMQLSERQDMLLGQACKIYQLASLSLDDIFEQVPQPNQLCLITAMMLLSQKPNSEAGSLINQGEPWDPLTLFQRWIIRSRVAGAENSGLDLGESQYHAEALEIKLAALNMMPASEKVQCLQCQISSELGQYYCWSGQYDQAIIFLEQCQEVHKLYPSPTESHLKCGLNINRTTALLKMSRLAMGVPLVEDPKENLVNLIKGFDRSHEHMELVDAFKEDNITRSLPFTWRQQLLLNVLNRSDLENGVFLAVANALYNPREPSDMMLEIPSAVLTYLRSVTFESGHEVDAYLSSSVFENLMEFIAEILSAYTAPNARIPGLCKNAKEKITAFVSKFCAGVRHVLCYDAAWKTGLLEPSANDWSLVWDMYSFVLARDIPTTETLIDQLLPTAEATEAAAKSLMLEHLDAENLEDFLRNKTLPPLTCCLVTLTMSAQACTRAHYPDSVRFLQATRRFLAEEQQQHQHQQHQQHQHQQQDISTSPAFKQIEFQLGKYSAWSQIGILAEELEQRRESRLSSRLEQRVKAKAESVKSARREAVAAAAGGSATTMMAVTEGEAMVMDDMHHFGANNADNDSSAMRMDVDGDSIGNSGSGVNGTAFLGADTQERQKKEEQAKEEEQMTAEISRLMTMYLQIYGALELNLQLRCLALCINAKMWDFLSGYGRAGAEELNKSIHGEICQVYSVLVPLCAILSRSQTLGVDLKDITSASCLDAIFSSDLDPIHFTRVAAFDMIQGLMPNVTRPQQPYLQQQQQQPSAPSHSTNSSNSGYRQKGRKSIQEEGLILGPGPGPLDEDLGHAVILKLFNLVRLRGVVDVFGALLAGAVSAILPERAKLTLSEFGYYALFTTSMDSVSSWTDPRVKIIAMLSSGDAGKAIEAVSGARQRFAKLLIQVYELQVHFESDTLTKKLKIEAKALWAPEQRFDVQTGLTKDASHTSLLVFSSRAAAQLTRYSLCLTDLYYLEGLHQDALASFLNACMVASKCFEDMVKLDRRVWVAYTHGPILPSVTLSPPLPTSGSVMQHIVVPSQSGAQVQGAVGPAMFGSPQDGQIMPMYPTLSALTSMNSAAGGTGGPPPPPPPPPLPPPGMPGQVGLGLSPSPSPDINGAVSPMTPPPPPPLLPGIISPGAVPPMMSIAPSPIPGSSIPPVVPSTFALRAIDSCMQLNEPLASVAMQQFLPRMDHNQAFAAIRVAHEQGMLSFSGKGLAPATVPGAATPLTGAAVTGNNNNASGTGPGMALTPPTNSGALMGAAGSSGVVAHLLSGSGAVAPTVGSPGIVLASPRVQSSSSVFTPELNAAITDQLASVARRGSNFVASSATLLASRWVGNSLPRQMFLDLLFDLSLLELISFLCKESKDQQGMLLIQARINSNRLALDGRMAPGPMQLQQRSPIRDMTQQDLLTRLWSRYARVG